MARIIPRMHWANALTGGGTGALDKIDGSDLIDLDAAVVVTTANFYLYILDDDSAAAESSPDVISPDSNAGDKRWILTEIVFAVPATVLATLSAQAGATFDWNDQQISNIKSIAFNDGGATVTQVKDEDDMASDSATMLATQQSIKKYVDDNVGVSEARAFELDSSGNAMPVDATEVPTISDPWFEEDTNDDIQPLATGVNYIEFEVAGEDELTPVLAV